MLSAATAEFYCKDFAKCKVWGKLSAC